MERSAMMEWQVWSHSFGRTSCFRKADLLEKKWCLPHFLKETAVLVTVGGTHLPCNRVSVFINVMLQVEIYTKILIETILAFCAFAEAEMMTENTGMWFGYTEYSFFVYRYKVKKNHTDIFYIDLEQCISLSRLISQLCHL